MTHARIVLAGALLLAIAPSTFAAEPGERCGRGAAQALVACLRNASAASLRCFRATGTACPAVDARTTRALGRVERRLLDRCADAAAVGAAGYAPLGPDGLVARFQAACVREVAAVAARTFGGPDGPLLAGADAKGRRCLLAAARQAGGLVAKAVQQAGRCTGGTCNLAAVEAALAARAAAAARRIDKRCPDLAALVGLDTATFAARAAAQAVSAAASPCDPLDQARCLFPLTNDYASVADPTTPSGRRLALASVAMPVNSSALSVDPTAWNVLDGFSVGPLLIVHAPDADLVATDAPLQTDIARSLDADTPVALIDAETGERQLLWVERDQSAAVPSQRPLMIRVGRNLPNGRRFVVALRDIRDAGGVLLDPSPTFAAYRDRIPTGRLPVEARRPHMEEIFAILEDAGIPRASLFLAWDFTTQSTESTARAMLHMRDDAFQNVLGAAAPAFQVTSVVEPLDANVFRRVDGTFQAPLYLTNGGAPGSLLRRGPDGLPVNQGDFFTARFRCLVPYAATTGGGAPAVPARAALYGHGLLGSETETSAGNVRDMANEHDFVICGTRWTGFEEDDLSTVLQVIQNFSAFPKFIERQHQGLLNFLVLGRLMIHPDGLGSDPAFQVGGQSVIDPSGLFFDGNSQGGIMGGALAAFAQDATRFVLGVPGINYSTLLNRSTDFAPFFQALAIFYPSGLDRAVLLSVAQIMWDQTDPSGHVRHVTADTYPNTPSKKILYQVAFGDHQVAPVTVEVAARSNGALLRVPAVSPAKVLPDVDPYFGIPEIPSYPFDGSAVVIWDSGNPAPPVGNVAPPVINPGDPGYADLLDCAKNHGSDPHECPRRQPAARLQKSEFLRNGGAVIDTCGGAPCLAPDG